MGLIGFLPNRSLSRARHAGPRWPGFADARTFCLVTLLYAWSQDRERNRLVCSYSAPLFGSCRRMHADACNDPGPWKTKKEIVSRDAGRCLLLHHMSHSCTNQTITFSRMPTVWLRVGAGNQSHPIWSIMLACS
jgi:hypothetical protein